MEKIKGQAASLSDDGDYDGLDYENSSGIQANQERTEATVFQNPYYDSSGDLNTNTDIDLNLVNDTKDAQKIKVVENPYYGDI